MIAPNPPAAVPTPPHDDHQSRTQLRLQSIGWALVLGSLAWDGASTLGFAPVDAGCFMDCWPFICTVPTRTISTYRPGSWGQFVAFEALECPYPLTTGTPMAWHW